MLCFSQLAGLAILVFTVHAFPSSRPYPQYLGVYKEKTGVPQHSGFTVTFSDDFSGAYGGLSSNWLYDIGTSYQGGPANWGTGELETYTSSLTNIALDGNGCMVIQPQYTNGVWTSSRVETVRGDFMCQPGGKMLVEASIMLQDTDPTTQQGIWPAFWAMGQAYRQNGYTGWPGTGEWDIMEVLNGQNVVHGTVHCGVSPGGPCDEPVGMSGSATFERGAYHTFGFLVDRTANSWQKESVTWLLDGIQYKQVLGSNVGDAETWTQLVHAPMYILFNVAVGGGWPGLPNYRTMFGRNSSMSVDYVAVYNS